MKMFIPASIIVSSVMLAGAAHAASTQDQLAMCAAELDKRNVAEAADYRPKFKSVRGGGLKKVKLAMIPTVDGKEPIEVVCSIRRGEVVDVVVKS